MGTSVQKSPDAFRTISEVAVDLDVPQHVLRFWETKFSQVRPLKRGGGRRYYRPEDVDMLRGVRTLLYTDGYTIKGVQKVFREHGVRYVIETGRGAVGETRTAVPSRRRGGGGEVLDSSANPNAAVSDIPMSGPEDTFGGQDENGAGEAELADLKAVDLSAVDLNEADPERLRATLADLIILKHKLGEARLTLRRIIDGSSE